MGHRTRGWLGWFAENLVIAVIYYIVGELSRATAMPEGVGCTVWPAAGFALFLSLRFGNRYLFGVGLSGFLVIFHVMLERGFLLALGSSLLVGVGTSLQAFTGAKLISLLIGPTLTFDRVRNVVRFITIELFACAVSPTFAAIGIGSFLSVGFWRTWGVWWLGDFGGVLVFMPLLLLFSHRKNLQFETLSFAKISEGFLFIVLFLAYGVAFFTPFSALAHNEPPFSFICIPFLVWAAIRFDIRGTVILYCLLSFFTVYAARVGVGPFVRGSLLGSLICSQAFLIVVVTMGLILTASISELRNAQDEIRKFALDAKSQLSVLFESAIDAIVIFGSDGVIRDWNVGAVRMFGYDKTDVLGKQIAELFHPDQKGVVESLLAQGSRGVRIGPNETILLRKDGTGAEVSFTSAAIEIPNPKVSTISIIFHDISKMKNAQRAVEEAREKLEQRVEERTKELLKVNKELERSSTESKEFAYVVSHDLQEPLRTISMHLELLNEKVRPMLEGEHLKSFNFVYLAAARARTLISDLLAFSRLEGDEESFEVSDLNEVLDTAKKNLTVQISTSGAVIESVPLPKAIVIKSQFVQLFQNLLSNAIKFRAAHTPKILIHASEEAGGWVFSVSDNGIGIEERFLKQIFTIFKRLHSREKYPGTGIGLAICKKIVERHGGKIWATSQHGKGTSFHFLVPSANEATSSPT